MRDVGKDFLGDDYDALRRALSKKQIKAMLRRLAKNIEQKLGGAEKITAISDNVLPERILHHRTRVGQARD